MGDNDVSVESVEVALLSEIARSSAMMMKNAYLPPSMEVTDQRPCAPDMQPEKPPHKVGITGPNALVYVTKIFNRTPMEEIGQILKNGPGHTIDPRTYDVFTLVLTLSIRLGDPSTTRFINGMVDIAFSPGAKILTWSPKDKGIITAVIEKGREILTLSPGLVFLAPAENTKKQASLRESRFIITVGPGEKITGTYNKKTGYSLDIPACALMDYQGVLKNEHEMFWEIYPPMPTEDTEITGNEMHAVFSLIVQVPKNTPLTINALIEGRLKGDLWGVIPLKGSAVF